MNLFMLKSKEAQQKQQKSPIQGLNIVKKEESKDVQQKKVVEQIAQINILKEQMLDGASSFYEELNQLQNQLTRKSNELDITTSQQMNEISQKNISLVKQFLKYQESLIKKLQGKTSNWDNLHTQLKDVQIKFNDQMQQSDLPVKLAKIQILEDEIQILMNEIEDLNRENERRKW